MPIDWTTFKQTTKNYFVSYTAKTEQQAANFIADQYEIAILTGGDLTYNNVVLTYTKPTLSAAIGNAFTQANNPAMNESVVPNFFGTTISQGLIGFWSGATLAPVIPPPGSTAVVTNVVSVPGTPVPRLEVSATENEDEFIDNLIDFFTQHLQSLSGVTTALVTTPSGPVPTPFPWVGYG